MHITKNTGDVDFEKLITGMRKRSADLSAPLKNGAGDFKKLIVDSFSREKDPTGVAWSPLAQSTIDAREREGVAANKRTKSGMLTKGSLKLRAKRTAPGGMKILVVNGMLKNSIDVKVRKTSIVMGTNVKYFLPNQFGASENNLPARMMIPFEKVNKGFQLANRGPVKEIVQDLISDVKKYIVSGKK